MFTKVVKDKFNAAHHLPGVPICEIVHRHVFEVEVSVSSPVLNDKGMVVDFRDIKSVASDMYDHKDLNDYFKMPTAEVIARGIFLGLMERYPKRQFNGWGIEIVRNNPIDINYVRVWESPDAYAEYRE